MQGRRWDALANPVSLPPRFCFWRRRGRVILRGRLCRLMAAGRHNEILTSPVEPEKCMVHLYLPDLPCMRTSLYIQLILYVQFAQFLYELFRISIVGLISPRCSNK